MRAIGKCYVLIFLFFANSCSKEKIECNVTAVNKNNIQGDWEYIQPDDLYNLVYQNYYFTFYGDSFKLKYEYFGDWYPLGTPCESGSYTDYVRGAYNITGNEIILNGNYCDSTFSFNKNSIDSTQECYWKGFGVYNRKFSSCFCNDSLILNSFSPSGLLLTHIPLLKN